MLSGKQQAIFQPLKEAAWQAYCARNPALSGERLSYDAWYRQTLVQEVGIYTTKEIPADDQPAFDALCLVFATIGGDTAQIDYWSSAAERRALWRIRETMKNAGVDMNYVRGIMRNMNLADKAVEDLPAELILKINTAVYIHMKRKQKSSCRASACGAPSSSVPISVHPCSSVVNSSSILSPEDDPELSFP